MSWRRNSALHRRNIKLIIRQYLLSHDVVDVEELPDEIADDPPDSPEVIDLVDSDDENSPIETEVVATIDLDTSDDNSTIDVDALPSFDDVDALPSFDDVDALPSFDVDDDADADADADDDDGDDTMYIDSDEDFAMFIDGDGDGDGGDDDDEPPMSLELEEALMASVFNCGPNAVQNSEPLRDYNYMPPVVNTNVHAPSHERSTPIGVKPIPEGHVLVMLTGPPPTTRPLGAPRSLKMAIVKRILSTSRFLRSSIRTVPADEEGVQPCIFSVFSINQCIFESSINITPDYMAHMTSFIYMNGVSQKNKILDRNKEFAAYETRINTFSRCEKSLLQEIPALCESGLVYRGNGSNDLMKCYCCGTRFKKWKYLINPWVQHAIRSPDCALIQLYKGKQFVDEVHETYNLIKTCSIWDFQELFYDLFSLFDLGLMDRTLGYGDDESRTRCIDQMVSVKMTRCAPDLLHQTSIDLNRAPLPNDVTCKICFREKIEVLFVPCGHMYACSQCAVTLHECAICRETFSKTTYALRVTMVEEEVDDDGNSQLPSTSNSTPGNSDSNSDTAICRVCKKEPIGVANVPCLHVHTCYQCAIRADNCPVCHRNFFALIQVFL